MGTRAVTACVHGAGATAATTEANPEEWEGPTSTPAEQHPPSAAQQATGVPHDGQSNGHVTALSTAGHEHAQQQVQGGPEAGPSEDSDRTQQASTQQVAVPWHTGQGSAQPAAQHAAPSGAEQHSPGAHLAPRPPGGSRGLSGSTEAAAVHTRCSEAPIDPIMTAIISPARTPGPHKPRGCWSRMTSCLRGLGSFKMAAAVSAEQIDGLSRPPKESGRAASASRTLQNSLARAVMVLQEHELHQQITWNYLLSVVLVR